MDDDVIMFNCTSDPTAEELFECKLFLLLLITKCRIGKHMAHGGGGRLRQTLKTCGTGLQTDKPTSFQKGRMAQVTGVPV